MTLTTREQENAGKALAIAAVASVAGAATGGDNAGKSSLMAFLTGFGVLAALYVVGDKKQEQEDLIGHRTQGFFAGSMDTVARNISAGVDAVSGWFSRPTR